VLALLTIAAIVALLVGMGVSADTRSQLVLSLVSLAVVLGLYFLVARGRSMEPARRTPATSTTAPHRVLIVANKTLGAEEPMSELRDLHAASDAELFVCVPANPVDTGQAEHHGAVYAWEATQRAAQERLGASLAILRDEGLRADGAVGDFRPMVALDASAERFRPDRIVISTHPGGRSVWLRQNSSGGWRRSTTCRSTTSSRAPPPQWGRGDGVTGSRGCAKLDVPCGAAGTWRSLVAHLTGGQGVAGSNPVVPTRHRGAVPIIGTAPQRFYLR
jgi:hypothetical protein